MSRGRGSSGNEGTATAASAASARVAVGHVMAEITAATLILKLLEE
jgi:hypothetical protein